ncbi:ABC transporter substrate-binding protein [Marinomonas colpomeniae]|uniref:Iron-siderophore ABC transporter substrate-binding protein n=1 Tax=Marinomonas colpomeniae TaxID=2774408 RepID=A0ABR8NXM3_9GAMM|nr:iron-siderophore ABC transporter substrate-binding protein [Marinomonas colpomeniae]MBD5770791.1 iron-siderophore ABC transporter substrate-binding protein [Marinomonas colpomeniae]
MKRYAMCLTLLLSFFGSHTSHAESTSACLSTCIELPKAALRVVALNWTVAEMLLTLDIVPVGVTQGNGYRKWQTNHPALPKTVTEIGSRQEPNLAAIAKLKPDLIIGYEFRHRRILSSLKTIAPTLLYQQFPNALQTEFSYFKQSQDVFLEIAKTLHKTPEAKVTIQTMHQRLEELKQQLTEAGLANSQVSYGKFVGMGYGLRMFTNKSLAGAISNQLGLDYSWQDGLLGKDFTHLQLEQLPTLKNSHLILAGNQVDSERMMESPVWPLLPFVKQNKFSEVPPLFSFGGPLSAIKMAEAFTQSLLTWQQNPHD